MLDLAHRPTKLHAVITRGAALGLIGAALLSDCGRRTFNTVRVGSQNSRENATIAEIYAAALERVRIPVERRMYLRDAHAELERGGIDLYPAYVPSEFDERDGMAALARAPVVASPCLVTSQYAAEEYWLLSLDECSNLAGRLRLAATAAFLKSGALRRLRRLYGGFQFKAVTAYDPGAQYDALNRGDADVANGLTTASNIAEDALIVLHDDKRVWPRKNLAPIVSIAALRAHPQMAVVLDRISHTLTQFAVQHMNMRLDLLYLEPRDVAEDFVTAQDVRPTSKPLDIR